MQEAKIIPMIYDKAFKSILTSKEVRSYLIDIISDVIKIDKEEIRKNIVFKQNEHNLLGINEKRKTSDLIVEISYGVINLEMNKDWYDGLFDRNHEYISKIRENILKEEKRYNKLKKVIQINFDNFNIYKTEEIILKFEMMNEKGIYDRQEHERMVRNSIMATKLEDSYYKGAAKKNLENARKMKEENIAIDIISRITSLSKEQIEKL